MKRIVGILAGSAFGFLIGKSIGDGTMSAWLGITLALLSFVGIWSEKKDS